MTRFVQVVPEPPDPFESDPLLRAWLRHHLGGEDGEDGEDRAAASRLTALAAEVAGPLRDAHRDAESHPPRLVRYDPWGARIDRVETSPGWEAHRRAAARHALVALPYLPGAREQWGAATRVVQHGLLHLYGPESATFSCPVAMSDGAATLLGHEQVDPAIRDAWLPRLLSTDPRTAITSGQWMTEASGGSDLSHAATTARPDPDPNPGPAPVPEPGSEPGSEPGEQAPGGVRSWRLTGEKWFCSAIDAEVAVVLARPEGAAGGSRTLAPFLVPRAQEGVRIHRLKDKLGTRALPTAEVGLRDAYALPLGDPARPGLARMMTLVRVARLHNAAAAAAGMRRGLAYARAFAGARHIAGGRLADHPLHRATLGVLEVDTAGAFVLAGHAFALLGRVEVDADPAAATELRIVAPLAKLATAKLAVAAASELLECFGGAGYVEDTGIPRLLRDAQVLPIWEGTTNVLALDVLRAVTRDGAAAGLLARVDAAAGQLDGPAGAILRTTATELRAALAAVTADPAAATVVAGARALALRLAYALAGALLATWDDPLPRSLAGPWIRRWLAGHDLTADLTAARMAEVVAGAMTGSGADLPDGTGHGASRVD